MWISVEKKRDCAKRQRSCRKDGRSDVNIEWKNCFRVGISAFLLFLGIYYWDSVTKWAWLIVGAAAPLLIGVIIAYVLNILMSFYERLWFPRSRKKNAAKGRRVICLILAILTLLGIVAAVVGLVLPELIASVQLLIDLALGWLPGAMDELTHNESIAELLPEDVWVALENINWKELINKAIEAVTSGIGGAVGTVAGVIGSVFSTLVTVLVALIFALYLLINKERLMNQGNRLMNVYLRPNVNRQVRHVLDVLNDCFHRYVVGQCIEAVILGVLCMLGMFIFRFPYATMIGTLVGFTALIPIAGAYIGAAVGAFMILTVSPVQAVLFVVYLTILQQLEGNLIYPRVVGSSLGLPGLWVLAAVTVGGGLYGVLGMLIGVPLAAAGYRLLREDVIFREGKSGRHESGRRKRHGKSSDGQEKSQPQMKPEQNSPKEQANQKQQNSPKTQTNQKQQNSPKAQTNTNQKQQTRPQTKPDKPVQEKNDLSQVRSEGEQGTAATTHKRRRRKKKKPVATD